MTNSFLYFEQILEAVYNGDFNEMMSLWLNGTDRAMVNYLYTTKCSLKEVEVDLGISDVKKRLQNIALYYDNMDSHKHHESFSKSKR